MIHNNFAVGVMGHAEIDPITIKWPTCTESNYQDRSVSDVRGFLWFGMINTIYSSAINTLRLRQNGRHFQDIFKCIFLNENVKISIKISLKFVPKGPVNYITALNQIMAWCRPGDKSLSEPMMVSLLTQICITLPQWVKYVLWYSKLAWFFI